MDKPFYLTTTLPYVNADPHIGFALELIQADAIVRYQRLCGREVIFNTGTDEHGQKIFQKAQEEGEDVQAYTDRFSKRFQNLAQTLNASTTNFIRTSNPDHKAAAQEIWKRCEAAGDIYKKSYKGLYCVGDEMFVKEGDLVNGECPNHPGTLPVEIEEENYFFKFSKYQQQLLDYLDQPGVVVPEWRREEAKKFVSAGLEDFSISRKKERLPWGVPVPGDEDQVMYVWFDALTNYISTLGWPDDAAGSTFDTFWNNADTVQVAGKDQVRFQSLMWQAMLMSAGVKNTDKIFYHGFISSDGQKMSKSIGNVVDPYAVVEKYGVDAVRFYLLGALPSYEDGDWSTDRFEEYYTAHLANGIGNLTSRVLTMVEKYADGVVPGVAEDVFATNAFWKGYEGALEAFDFERAVGEVNIMVGKCDALISEQKPWEKAKAGEDIGPLLYQLTEALRHIGLALLPFIPTSAEKILGLLSVNHGEIGSLSDEQKWGGVQEGTKVQKGDPLFPRLS